MPRLRSGEGQVVSSVSSSEQSQHLCLSVYTAMMLQERTTVVANDHAEQTELIVMTEVQPTIKNYD